MIKEFFKLQDKLHEYFGYKEDWCIFPMQDYTKYWWSIPDDKCEKEYETLSDGQKVCLSYENNFFFTDDKEPHLKLIEFNWKCFEAGVADKCYNYEIYSQRFLNSVIFRGEEYTMILVDTHTDGNRYLMIVDNKKRLDKKIIRKIKLESL